MEVRPPDAPGLPGDDLQGVGRRGPAGEGAGGRFDEDPVDPRGPGDEADPGPAPVIGSELDPVRPLEAFRPIEGQPADEAGGGVRRIVEPRDHEVELLPDPGRGREGGEEGDRGGGEDVDGEPAVDPARQAVAVPVHLEGEGGLALGVAVGPGAQRPGSVAEDDLLVGEEAATPDPDQEAALAAGLGREEHTLGVGLGRGEPRSLGVEGLRGGPPPEGGDLEPERAPAGDAPWPGPVAEGPGADFAGLDRGGLDPGGGAAPVRRVPGEGGVLDQVAVEVEAGALGGRGLVVAVTARSKDREERGGEGEGERASGHDSW